MSLWVIPKEVDWTPLERSFDLLGTTLTWDLLRPFDSSTDGLKEHDFDRSSFALRPCLRHEDSLSRLDHSCRHGAMWNECDERITCKLLALLQATCKVFGVFPETVQQGLTWLGAETVDQLLVVAQIFAALEKQEDEQLSVDALWKHSIRTGCLAGFLAKGECGDSEVITQSCVAGYLHDIGLAMFAMSLGSSRYGSVVSRARRESLSLATAELHELGLSHDIVGAEYLQRHRFPQAIVDAVAFHDNPLGLGSSGVTPLLAVYAANILDGGGWPQDSDGIPSDRAMEYLSVHGYVDPWPKWHRYVAKIQSQELGYA